MNYRQKQSKTDLQRLPPLKGCTHRKQQQQQKQNKKPTGKRLSVKEDIKTSSLKKEKKGKIKGAHLLRKIRKKTFKPRKLQVSWAPKCWSHSAFPRLLFGLE